MAKGGGGGSEEGGVWYNIIEYHSKINAGRRMVMSKKLGGRQKLNQTNLNTVPDKPGIYLVRNKKGDAQYIGMTKTLQGRIGQHLSQRDIPGAESFQIRTTRAASQAEKLEGKYIQRYRPTYNIQKKK